MNPSIKQGTPFFRQACLNVADLVWSGKKLDRQGKEELWERLPLVTRELIEEFVLHQKEGPIWEDHL